MHVSERVYWLMYRVCFVSSFPPSQGRLAEYAYYLINALQESPEINHMDIIADMANDRTTKRISDKIALHRIWKPDNLISLLSIPLKILELRPHIIHFNVHMAVFGRSRLANFVGLSLPFFCRLMGFQTVVTLHNIAEKVDIEKAGFKNTSLNRLGAFLATKLLALSSAVTLTMRSYVELLRRKYRCKNVVWIPHGTWNINLTNGNCALRTETILYIGHSGPYKDLELLFEAFRILKKRKNGVKLVIAGRSHPNYPGFLEKYEAGNSSHDVQFTGYVPEEQLPQLFEKVDVIVLPYHTCTGTSGVAHLASSFGTPIIATDLPEFRELGEEACGIVLSRHDPEAFAERIERVLMNPNLASELKERNLRFARGRTWDKIASSFCKVYKQVM